METLDPNPYRTPIQPEQPAGESNWLFAPVRRWLANLTASQLLLFSMGSGFLAFSMFSLVTAQLLRQRILGENPEIVNITELLSAPVQGLLAAFIGAFCIAASRRSASDSVATASITQRNTTEC